MMAVKIATQPTLRAEPAVELWQRHYWAGAFPTWSYDVGHDGRFLMLQTTGDAQGAARTVNVVLNWFDELKRLVPAN